MDLIRDSWNHSRSSQEFISLLEGQNSSLNVQDIILSLLTICSRLENSPTIFYDYLKEVALKYPQVFIEILLTKNNEYSTGFAKLIEYSGRLFFDIFPVIESKEIGSCIFKILKIITEDISPNESSKIICKITEDNKFSMLVSMSRLFFDDEIIQLRPKIDKFLDFDVDIPLFKKSVFSDVDDKNLLFQHHNLNMLIFPYIALHSNFDSFLRFFSMKSFLTIYLRLINEFLNNQTIVGAYLLEKSLIDPKGGLNSVLSFIRLNESKKSQDESYFNSTDRNYSDIHDVSFSDYHFNTDNSYISDSYVLDSLTIERILTSTVTSQLPSNELIHSIYNHPSTILNFDESLIYLVHMNSISQFLSLVPLLSEIPNDIILYLAIHGQLVNFLYKLSILCEQIENEKTFEPVWYLLLYYVELCWSHGSLTIKNMINELLIRVSPFMKYYLLAMLNKAPPELEAKPTSPATPFLKSVRLLGQLMADNSITIIKKISSKASTTTTYVWPSIIISLLCSPKPEYKILSVYTIPHYPILDILFEYLMKIIEENPVNYLISLISSPNYDLLLKHKPENIVDLNKILKVQIEHLDNSVQLTQQELSEIICCWRAWTTSFGLTEFLENIINIIISVSIRQTIPSDSIKLFEVIAYILSIVSDFKNQEIEQLITKALSIVSNSINSSHYAIGMSRFCLSLICLAEEGTIFFHKIFEFARKTISNQIENNRIITIFAFDFIRTSLFTPCLQEFIIKYPVDYILEFNDSSTAIDYFIVKTKLTKQQNNFDAF
ncbi:hypothetical protein TRFO_32084 [Tritrichomonas foetus]|uniref:Uncharacterized protein n=1 Tax=Tritrichomonas foetus TaxID=1144522 RepID=A0A1J4JR23_9EUKA|nr:hypothetical protein TRFO_32084 [Tritrichomonas foetus]|eukprot:OHT01194.1 hypothetical protein TRFO_32084 [Tritrichomonas foetus]